LDALLARETQSKGNQSESLIEGFESCAFEFRSGFGVGRFY
jgi:hypothetical protein